MWLSLLACAPEVEPERPVAPDELGGPLDVACEELAGDHHGAPRPWGEVSPVFEDYVDELLQSPYRQGLAEHVVEDVSVHGGSLYAAVGDSGTNPGSRFCVDLDGACPWEDAPGHGLPLYRFDPGSHVATWHHVVREEEVVYRRIGDALLVPGRDPTEGDPPLDCELEDAVLPCPEERAHDHPEFTVGIFHLLRDGRWTDAASVPTALHLYDVTRTGGRWFVAGSSRPEDTHQSRATVWGSDDGERWGIELLGEEEEGTQRMTTVVPVGREVVAMGYEVGKQGHWAVRDPSGRWRVLPSLGLGGPVWSEAIDPDRALAWSSHGAAVLESEGGRVSAARVRWLEEGERVVDAWLLCEGDLLVLVRTPDGHRVLRTADGVDVEPVAAWTGTPALASMAVWEGTLAFGDDQGRVWRSEAR